MSMRRGNEGDHARLPALVTQPLFRRPEEGTLFGVCAGLARRFAVDPLWLRLGFVLLALVFGKGILLYALLVFLMPRAPGMLAAQ